MIYCVSEIEYSMEMLYFKLLNHLIFALKWVTTYGYLMDKINLD
jgi:hypothetical protein